VSATPALDEEHPFGTRLRAIAMRELEGRLARTGTPCFAGARRSSRRSGSTCLAV